MNKLLIILFLFIFNFQVFSDEKDPENNFFANFNNKENFIAITFDDGPSKINTPELLKILKENNIKVTFFVQGYFAKKYPEVIKQINDEGQEIGIHLWGHENYYDLSKKISKVALKKKLENSIKLTEEAVQNVTRKKPNLLRFPYGYCKKWALEIAREKGYRVVNWTFGCDWNKMSQEEFINKMKKNTYSGAVLLMHDGGSKKRETISAVPEIIKHAQSKGLKFVTVSEMLSKINNKKSN